VIECGTPASTAEGELDGDGAPEAAAGLSPPEEDATPISTTAPPSNTTAPIASPTIRPVRLFFGGSTTGPYWVCPAYGPGCAAPYAP
jgi:hypothetical protein